MSPNINISKHHKKIAIVAGEKSGDELGAPLMESIRRELPDVEFIGLGGESMKKKGLESFFDIKDILVIEGDEQALPKNIFNVLKKHEIPKEIIFIKTFKRTSSGKINRHKTLLSSKKVS